MSQAAINRYKADLRDHYFVMLEQFKLQDLMGKPPFEDWGEEQARFTLEEYYRFCCDVVGPLNQIGDQQGCRLENGQVYTPDGFKDAWNKIYEAGWRSLLVSDEYGGQGAPRTLACLADEFLSGANTAFFMYPGLTMGAAEVIDHFGTSEQKKLFCQKMYDGEWGGTMCLSEPNAGSDVGAAVTKAVKNEDGTYNISGTKIWISGGDQDLTENVVHLVLARIEGAAAGTKGLSLFIVPKKRFGADGSSLESNDVQINSIEHKMGINGSATCVVEFGADGNCKGELVGTVEHQGMKQMFLMMNFARIGVGIQGLSVASTAYLNALEYAKDRKQGSSIKNWKDASAERAAIIEHPNIRQDLLDMKSRVEGIRALIVKLSMHQDHVHAIGEADDESKAYHQGQVDLLTPLVKAYATDQAFSICEKAIQIHGGSGFVKDYPVEQYCRDSKIFSIYEGTNAIQAMDLVARKLGQNAGANTKTYMDDIQKFITKNKDHSELGDAVKSLEKAHQTVGGTMMHLLGLSQARKMEDIILSAEKFLEMLSELSVAWLLLDAAVIALEKIKDVSDTHPDKAFYLGKKYAAIYFAKNVLPNVVAKSKIISGGDHSAMEIPDEAFSTLYT